MDNDTNSAPAKKRTGCIFAATIALITLAPLWFFFIGPQMRHDKLVGKGVHVPGRLIAVDETNTTVNDVPELKLTIEFTRNDGTLDTATCDFVPTLRTLHLYQPGMPVTAAYDPEDPEEITVVSLDAGEPMNLSRAQTAGSLDADSLKHVADSLAEELRRVKGE